MEAPTFKAYGAGCRCSPSEPQKAPFSLSTLHLPRYNSPSPWAAAKYITSVWDIYRFKHAMEEEEGGGGAYIHGFTAFQVCKGIPRSDFIEFYFHLSCKRGPNFSYSMHSKPKEEQEEKKAATMGNLVCLLWNGKIFLSRKEAIVEGQG